MGQEIPDGGQDTASHRLDQTREFFDIGRHKHIGADEDEIMGFRILFRFQQFLAWHTHQFDGHAADVALDIRLYRAILIGKAYPGFIPARLLKHADA